MSTLDRIKHAALLFAFFGLCALISKADAQTAPVWNEARITGTAPTQHVDGTPIVGAITYQIEKQTGSTWTPIATSSTLAYTQAGLVVGEHCYRARAVVGGVPSDPSNVACKTVVQPAPQPPVLRVVDGIAMSVRADWDQLAFVAGQVVGRVPADTECDRTRPLPGGFYPVARELVTWSSSNRPANVVARCGS